MMTTSPSSPDCTRTHRYPGVRSFDDDETDRRLFHGRDQDKYDLLQLVLAERLVVLFARSGIGKSSLINAGLAQPLREKGFSPMVVRVNSVQDDPFDSFYRGVKAACERGPVRGDIEACEPDDPGEWNRTSFWHFIKTFYVWGRGDRLLTPVLIFDQFEELFTVVSEKPRKRFINELADLVRGSRPAGSAASEQNDPDFSDRPPDVKVVLSIREDFMAHLEEMAERIPSIMKARFRLGPLTVDQARRAIVGPAQLDHPALATSPFAWSDGALQCTMDFLRKRVSGASGLEMGNEVEPFQLQLVCQFVENLVHEEGLASVSPETLGGEDALRRILARFYETSIDRLCRAFGGFRLRRRLQHFCEYGLITDRGRRLLRQEGDIRRTHRISPEILAEMVQLRLIRNEPRIGDNYYELTHDTLIAPILGARQKRQRRRRQRWTGAAVVALAGVIGTLAWFGERAQSAEARLEQVERSTRRSQLIQHARHWGVRGNAELAEAFYEALVNEGSSVDRFVEQVQQRIMKGNMLAARLDLDGAIQAYREAAGADVSASGEASGLQRRVPREYIRMGELLARAGHIQEALRLYEEAHMRYPLEKISAESWKTLCWHGGLAGDADSVVPACEQAVAAAVAEGRGQIDFIRDSRGLALATAQSGNVEAAIADFQAYVDWARAGRRRPQSIIAMRERWIAQLKGGEDLFDDPTTKQALEEEANRSRRLAATLLRREAGPEAGDMLGSLSVLVRTWSLDSAVLERLRARHPPLCEAGIDADIETCNDRWEKGILPRMAEIDSNVCSMRLREIVDGLTAIDELFVTNANGFNECMSHRTSDYYQAEEEWWMAARQNRAPADPVGYDESAGYESYDVVVTIRDPLSPGEELLGVMKAVFRAESLSTSLPLPEQGKPPTAPGP